MDAPDRGPYCSVKAIPRAGMICHCWVSLLNVRKTALILLVRRLYRSEGWIAEELSSVDLSAVSGSPVLDIKPYYIHYDRPYEVELPEWVDRLMKEYF